MFAEMTLLQAALVFTAAAGVIAVCGVLMTGLADRLADLTGIGEAITGGMLLGAATSLSGTVVSITAALEGHASLAFANGVGGIAAQTAFLAVADLIWRRVNLEHAAADLANLFQAALLAFMLAVPLIAYGGPDIAVFGIHPASIVLVVAYIAGLRGVTFIRDQPMWRAVVTRHTREDRPDEAPASRRQLMPVLARFAALAIVLSAAGWAIAESGARISVAAGISQTAVGALMTAVATSLPELVTTVAAVRRGAAQLAVGGIIGGNVFDTLFLTLSDVAYRDGSLYHAIGRADILWVAVGLAMTAILLMGLIARERRGPAGIGVESMLLLLVYAAAVTAQAVQ